MNARINRIASYVVLALGVSAAIAIAAMTIAELAGAHDHARATSRAVLAPK